LDTSEVIQEESQAVLNTLKELDFQHTYKNSRSTGNGVYAQKGDYFEDDGGQRAQS
jgi:hypothetical protein